MALESLKSVKTQLNINSPVNKYNLLTLEQHAHGLTEEHILLAFQALDELIPQLGIFTQIFQKLRSDFLAAVYSDELTGTSENSKDYVQRKPYFLLVKQDQDQKRELINQLTDQLGKVKKSLFDKHKQLDEALEEVSSKNNQISELLLLQNAQQQKIQEQDNEIKELEKQLQDTKDGAQFAEHQLACDIVDLKEALYDAQNEIKNLSVYKKNYDDIYYAFLDNSKLLDDGQQTKTQSVISTKRANLENEIESAQRLEAQMLTIMNAIIEDYDKQVDTHKLTVMAKCTTQVETDAEQDLKELELDDANEELRHVQTTFQSSIGNLLNELGLLQQHSGVLSEHLQMLEELQPTLIKRKQAGSGWKGDSVLSAGLQLEEATEPHIDPFTAQEQIFSKYSAMMYTSNNQGKSFEEFKDAKYCPSCGEKTLICPHKLSGPEKIFILPHHCSHVKITRPRVRITKQDSMKDGNKEQSWDILQYRNSVNKSQTEPSTPNTDLSRESSLMGTGDTHMIYTTQRLWEDYYKRTSNERKIPRFLTLEQTKTMIEQLLGYLIWIDDFLTDNDGFDESILDILYRFMHDRYVIEDVANMAAHDFLTAITQYGGMDKLVQLFGHVLIGNLDAACLRYVLLILDFISAVEWKEVEDFRAFASALYPFLNDDDFENLQMSYTSYTENKISKEHVASFLMNLIIKYREPRFHDLEIKLVQYQVQENGHLTEVEFKEATENIVPLCNEQLRNRLYTQSEKSVQVDETKKYVPIMKLAHIAAYLALQQISTVVKENVVIKVNERRHKLTAETDSKQVNVDDKNVNTTGSPVLTMSYIKHLAANIDRQFQQQQDVERYS